MAKGKTTTETSIPDEFKQYYHTLLSGGQNALGDVDTRAYAGPRVAGYNDALQRGQGGLVSLAQQNQGLGAGTLQLGKDTLAGNYLMADANPYLQSAIEQAIRPVGEGLTQQILPQIGSAAQQQGAFGGARHGLMEGMAIQGALQQAGDISSGMAFDNYSFERGNQMMAPGLLQQGMGLNLISPQLYNQAGMQQQSHDQLLLDADRQYFAEQQMAPFAGLNQYASLLHGLNLGSNTTQSQQGAGPFGSALMGGAGGAGLGFLIGGPMGALGGGLLGAGAGALSSSTT